LIFDLSTRRGEIHKASAGEVVQGPDLIPKKWTS
jgi:hypothetical protein